VISGFFLFDPSTLTGPLDEYPAMFPDLSDAPTDITLWYIAGGSFTDEQDDPEFPADTFVLSIQNLLT
jgi:hypothetical protein